MLRKWGGEEAMSEARSTERRWRRTWWWVVVVMVLAWYCTRQRYNTVVFDNKAPEAVTATVWIRGELVAVPSIRLVEALKRVLWVSAKGPSSWR